MDQWAKVELYQRKTHLADLARHAKFGEAIFTLRDVHKIPIKRLALPLQLGAPAMAAGGGGGGGGASPVPANDPTGASVVVRLAEIAATASPGHVDFSHTAAAGLAKQQSTFFRPAGAAIGRTVIS